MDEKTTNQPTQAPLIHFPSKAEEIELADIARQEVRQSLEREQRREARWNSDRRKAMTELANLFPTMRGIMGTDPWDVTQLIAWLNTGAPTSGSKWAALFLLGVWNPHTNWYEEGLRKFKYLRVGKFDFFSAYSVWDYKHIDAFQQWVTNPFWA